MSGTNISNSGVRPGRKPKPFSSRWKENPATGCHEWQDAKSKLGYGRLKVAGKPVIAHRHAYELVHGPIPDGLSVMHSCDNRSCVNPEHLSIGSHQQNMRDMARKGRTGGAKLSPSDAQRLKDMWGTGQYAQTELAALFGVHQAHVSRTVRGERWHQ